MKSRTWGPKPQSCLTFNKDDQQQHRADNEEESLQCQGDMVEAQMPCGREGWNVSTLVSLTQCGTRQAAHQSHSEGMRLQMLGSTVLESPGPCMRDLSVQLSGLRWPEPQPPPPQEPKFLPGSVHSTVHSPSTSFTCETTESRIWLEAKAFDGVPAGAGYQLFLI